MRAALGPIPLGAPITDRDGTITPFFRQRWQDVSDGATETPTKGPGLGLAGQTASVAPVTVWTATVSGVYRVSTYLRITQPDPVSSSAQVVVQFTGTDGVGLYYALDAVTGNAFNTWQGAVMPIRCLAPSDITVAVAYGSGTPGQMRYDLEVKVEFVP